MTLRLNNDNGNSANIDYVDGVSTDSTITIPEGNGTVAMVGAAGGLAGNISRATLFRLESDFSNDNSVVTGWNRPNPSGVGDVVTESSGVFTFPGTGIWMVLLNIWVNFSGQDNLANAHIRSTNDGGTNWVNSSLSSTGSTSSTGTDSHITCMTILDITDTANDLAQIFTSSWSSTTSIGGSNTDNRSSVLFLRLGDT